MELKILIVSLVQVIGICCANNIDKLQDLQVELAQIHFRHGERTPLDVEFMAYSYQDPAIYKPYGFGHLTNAGKRQMYNVGRMLRERYGDFLNQKYDSNDVYAYSSDTDRTKMSLQLVLAGLYPPSKDFEWNPDLKWIPLPYLYTPKKLDIILQGKYSSTYRKLLKKVQTSAAFKEEFSQYLNLTRYLQKKGAHVHETQPESFVSLRNLLHINEGMGFPLPKWYTSEIKNGLYNCVATIMNSDSYSTELKKTNGGTIIRTFLDNMNVNNTVINPRKIYLYSGHDVTLGAFLRALNIDDFLVPNFGLTLIFEKLRDSKDNRYVRLLAYNPLDDKFTPLKIKSCGDICPMNRYLEITREVTASDVEMKYLLNDFNYDDLPNLFFNDKSVRPKQ